MPSPTGIHTGAFLISHNNQNYYLDIPRNDLEGGNAYCSDYAGIRFRSPPHVYARVSYGAQIIVQYWMFYYFNDVPAGQDDVSFLDAGDHEADWEMVQIIFPINATLEDIYDEDAHARPLSVAFSQHGHPVMRTYSLAPKTGGHFDVHVANGTHANSWESRSCGVRDQRSASASQIDYTLEMFTDYDWDDFKGYWGTGLDVGSLVSDKRIEWKSPLEWIKKGVWNSCWHDGKKWSFLVHSPVELHISDVLGRHVGPIPGGNETQIPGADHYHPEDGTQLITIPSDFEAYPLTVTAAGNDQGSMTLIALRNLSESDPGTVFGAGDVPVTTVSLARLVVDGVDVSNLEMDLDGDGTFESSVPLEVPGLGTSPTPNPTSGFTPTPTAVPPPPDSLGDTNCDGLVDERDILAVLRSLGGLGSTPDCLDKGDVDGFAGLSPGDALLILEYWAGIIDNFPASDL